MGGWGYVRVIGKGVIEKDANSVMPLRSDAQPRYELLAPRFDGNLSLSLIAGQREFVALRANN